MSKSLRFRPGQYVGAAMRLIGVGVNNLIEGGYSSACGIIPTSAVRLNVVMDEIRERYGDDAILRASLLERPRDR